MELMEKLAALVPPGRMHLTRHFGLFASHSQWRAQIVLKPEKRKGFHLRQGFGGQVAPDGGYEKDKVKNTRWAKMLARTFGVDVSTCPQCGEELRIVSMVYDQMQIARYLRHIGLDAHPPPIAPARYHQLSIDDIYNDSPHPEEEVQAHPEY